MLLSEQNLVHLKLHQEHWIFEAGNVKLVAQKIIGRIHGAIVGPTVGVIVAPTGQSPVVYTR